MRCPERLEQNASPGTFPLAASRQHPTLRQCSSEGRDSFGRILAHVVLEDGRDYGQEMIARGLALPYEERDRGWC